MPLLPLPNVLRPFNRAVTNRVLGPLRGVRPFATIVHEGRRSGALYRTLVWAFEREGTVAIALTYGRHVDWARNLLAAGGGRIEVGGMERSLEEPRIAGGDEGREYMPAVVRGALSLLDVHEFLVARLGNVRRPPS